MVLALPAGFNDKVNLHIMLKVRSPLIVGPCALASFACRESGSQSLALSGRFTSMAIQ